MDKTVPAGEAAAGTQAAPEQEIARVRRELSRAVVRICPRWLADRADDLVQVALMRVLDAQPQGEGNAPVAASYLRRAAYSALVDEIRRLRRRQEVPLDADSPADETPVEAPSPEARAAGRELGRAIRECLKRLVAPRRYAVALHLQGHSVPESARILGWAAKRTENLVYRGLADLRSCLVTKGVAR